jgi:small redox-active disulfide protein 2
MLRIRILGAGCSNCERLYEVARKAVASLGVEAEIEKVTDYPEMMRYGILRTPGLVINEEVVMVGKVPSAADMAGVPQRDRLGPDHRCKEMRGLWRLS